MKVTLKDPGLHDTTIELPDDHELALRALIAWGGSYTEARGPGFVARRRLGEPWWTQETPSPASSEE